MSATATAGEPSLLRVTPETVYRMIRRGGLPCWGGSRKTRVTKRQSDADARGGRRVTPVDLSEFRLLRDLRRMLAAVAGLDHDDAWAAIHDLATEREARQ